MSETSFRDPQYSRWTKAQLLDELERLRQRIGLLEGGQTLKLRESDTRYQRLVELLPDAAIVHRDGQIVYANAGAAGLIGVRRPAELIGRRMQDYVHPQSRQAALNGRAASRSGSQLAIHLEVRCIRSDGVEFVTDSSVAPVHWEGQPATLLMLREVTERDETEGSLRRREESLAGAQRIAHLGSWERDLATNKEVWSAELCRIFGVTPGEGEASFAAALHCIHPDDRKRIEETARLTIRSGIPYDIEYRVRRPDGEERVVHSRGEVHYDEAGRPCRLRGSVQDITERKRAEEALRSREAQIRQIIDLVPHCLFVKDGEGNYLLANAAMAEAFGTTVDELTGRNEADIYPHPSHLARYRAEDRSVIRSGRAITIPEEPFFDADGHERIYRSIKIPYVAAEGKTPAVLGISEDITELRDAEQVLREAKDAADRANAAKSRFLAAASHDLRQPIQSLNLLLGALAEGLEHERDRNLMKLLEGAQACCASLGDGLEGLVEMSRLETSSVRPQRQAFPIATVLVQVEKKFQPQARDMDLCFRVVQSSIYVDSDPSLLGRILDNLVSNALRYTPSGGVLVGCRRRGQSLRVEVRDTGVGISRHESERIFEEFVRLRGPAPGHHQGLGLGLAIVDQLCRLLGLRTSKTSEPGKGSVFSIEVPRASAAARDGVAGLDRQYQQLVPAGGLVIVIEDDVGVLDATCQILEKWGFDVVGGHSSAEALDRLVETYDEPPDLVISDYQLLDGRTAIDAVAEIRTRFMEEIPAIIVTGDNVEASEIETRIANCRLLRKPYSPANLRSLVRHQIGTRTARRRARARKDVGQATA
jgi:PAS domain S-box-containing protein